MKTKKLLLPFLISNLKKEIRVLEKSEPITNLQTQTH